MDNHLLLTAVRGRGMRKLIKRLRNSKMPLKWQVMEPGFKPREFSLIFNVEATIIFSLLYII
jgi:hypothetical protein